MEIHWKSFEIYWNQWKLIEIYRNSQKSLKSIEIHWTSFDFHGIHCSSAEIHRNSLEILILCRKPSADPPEMHLAVVGEDKNLWNSGRCVIEVHDNNANMRVKTRQCERKQKNPIKKRNCQRTARLQTYYTRATSNNETIRVKTRQCDTKTTESEQIRPNTRQCGRSRTPTFVWISVNFG